MWYSSNFRTSAAYRGGWGEFYVVGNDDGSISLQSKANRQYICTVLNSIGELRPLEKGPNTGMGRFIPVHINETRYGLQLKASGKYVKVDLSNGAKLIAASDSNPGSCEAFTFETVD